MLYGMRYPNGKYVQMDTSTGPMSAGPYPYESDQPSTWSSLPEMAKYYRAYLSSGRLEGVVACTFLDNFLCDMWSVEKSIP